jgi:hypothetical protein
VGSGVLVEVGKGVIVAVDVAVAVEVTVAASVGRTTASGVCRCRAKYTMIAPIPRNKANKPIAAGRDKVIEGIRLPSTTLDDCEAFSVIVRSAPQTRQRVASSFTRVPQVGHNFMGDVFVSGVIFVEAWFLPGLGALYQLF